MIETRLFAVDPTTGITHWWHYDDETGVATIETDEPFVDVLETAKANFANTDERAPWGEGRHTGFIPNAVLMKILRDNPVWEDQQRALKHWMNDPDNSKFRTRPGRV